MRIGLIDVDGHNFPNLPLMKILAWHRKKEDEFDNPTNLASNKTHWNLEIIKPARIQSRKRSMTELLFCMLRAGH